MLKQLRSRWGVIPTWVKALPVAALLIVLSLLHGHLQAQHSSWLPEVRRLFFLPLFMASLLLGLKGGLLCALAISLNYMELSASNPSTAPAPAVILLEAGLYFLTGAITGLLVDRERREATRLKKAEELALLGQAAAAVAHELKTPLVAIGGFAQRLLRDLEPDHPQRRPLEIIVDQVAHMEQLLREMLDYSRPVELSLAPHLLDGLAEECLTLLDLLARQRSVRLTLRRGAGAPVAPVMDAARVRQVLLNLVQNAVQASGQGDEVVVETDRQGPWAVTRVSDQGTGIELKDQARVFSPFFSTKRQGTGLGLAISRKIVEAHGGELEFRSEPGRGSVFELRLPLEGPPGEG